MRFDAAGEDFGPEPGEIADAGWVFSTPDAPANDAFDGPEQGR